MGDMECDGMDSTIYGMAGLREMKWECLTQRKGYGTMMRSIAFLFTDVFFSRFSSGGTYKNGIHYIVSLA